MLSLKHLTTTVLSASLLVLPTFALSLKQTELSQPFFAQAQSNPVEATIDRAFRSGSFPPGTDAQLQRLVNGIRAWMGSYRGLRKEGNDYVAMFEGGELPVGVRQDAKGQIKSVAFGCPRSKSLKLSQASREVRQVLSKCPAFQN